MSLYLGKIHYWLFNKITWFEKLEEEIIRFAQLKDISVEEFKEKITNRYGEPTEDKPLEEMIDTSNIHGWLQNKIEMAEKRHAAWITYILDHNEEFKTDLINMFKAEGEKAGNDYREEFSPKTAKEIYAALNDFILEGMPCDRVTEVINNDDDIVLWQIVRCLHKSHWEEVNGDVSMFYILRDAWTKGFIEKVNGEFTYERAENGYQRIIRKGE